MDRLSREDCNGRAAADALRMGFERRSTDLVVVTLDDPGGRVDNAGVGHSVRVAGERSLMHTALVNNLAGRPAVAVAPTRRRPAPVVDAAGRFPCWRRRGGFVL